LQHAPPSLHRSSMHRRPPAAPYAGLRISLVAPLENWALRLSFSLAATGPGPALREIAGGSPLYADCPRHRHRSQSSVNLIDAPHSRGRPIVPSSIWSSGLMKPPVEYRSSVRLVPNTASSQLPADGVYTTRAFSRPNGGTSQRSPE